MHLTPTDRTETVSRGVSCCLGVGTVLAETVWALDWPCRDQLVSAETCRFGKAACGLGSRIVVSTETTGCESSTTNALKQKHGWEIKWKQFWKQEIRRTKRWKQRNKTELEKNLAYRFRLWLFETNRGLADSVGKSWSRQGWKQPSWNRQYRGWNQWSSRSPKIQKYTENDEESVRKWHEQ